MSKTISNLYRTKHRELLGYLALPYEVNFKIPDQNIYQFMEFYVKPSYSIGFVPF